MEIGGMCRISLYERCDDIFGPGSISSVIKGKEELESHAACGSKSHGQSTIIRAVVICHIQGESVYTGRLGV